MKRILFLIILVMLTTWFLRAGAHLSEQIDRDEREASRPDWVMFQSTATHDPKSRSLAAHKTRLTWERQDSDRVANSPPDVDLPVRKFESELMATEDRAEANAIRKLDEEVTAWLSPDVPLSWKPSSQLLRSMIRDIKITPIAKDYGTLYVAELIADTSAKKREKIIEEYRREAIRHRLLASGASLIFVLSCLGIVSAYIRADEATKGYYTTRLRILSAAGVGAAGVVMYRLI